MKTVDSKKTAKKITGVLTMYKFSETIFMGLPEFYFFNYVISLNSIINFNDF